MRKYFKHKIKSLLLINKLLNIHYIEPDEYFKTENEHHDFWELVYLDKGRLTCVANDKSISLSDGDIIFHKPNEIHSFLANAKEPTGILVISFECLSAAIQFFSGKVLRLNQKQKQFVREIIKIALKTYDVTFYNTDTDYMQLLKNPTLGGEQLIKNYLEMLLIDVMRAQTETEDGNDVFLQEQDLNNKLAEDIIKILKNNVYSRLSIDDIAKTISYSKAYIFRQFKMATGKSVMEYYLDIKIKVAKELIINNELSVKEISEKLSFDTPNYFTKTFKKLVGVTPTEYRKNKLNN